MTHFPWFKNTSRIDYTGYREFLSLLRYVHSSRAYYSTLSALSPGEKSEARQTVQNTHRAMLKAKSFLIHYKPKSALIRRLVYIEWQYLLQSNQYFSISQFFTDVFCVFFVFEDSSFIFCTSLLTFNFSFG